MLNGARELRVKVFADGADLGGIREAAKNPVVKGFTTNPTLMRKAGVDNYERFAHEAIDAVGGLPISFEVFSDDFDEMAQQALRISRWGTNVYVKIPVTDSSGNSSSDLLHKLGAEGVQLNVTAILALEQVVEVIGALHDGAPSFVSVFAGRVADTGVDPVPLMAAALAVVRTAPRAELIWASPREVLNIVQADQIGCDVITVTNDLIAKLSILGRDLMTYSLETVRMFRNDAVSAGFTL